MIKLREFVMRIGGLFSKQRKDRELDDEIESHLQMHIEDNLRSGMAAEEARRQAMIKLGGIESTKEACRDQRGLPWLEMIWQDVRYGARMLRKNPGFTAVSVLTLALGVGANTAVFQLLDAVRMRSLPVAKPQELAEVRVNGGSKGFGVSSGPSCQITHPLWELLRANADPFSGIFAWGNDFGFVIGQGVGRHGVGGLWVSGDFFTVLGLTPTRGRLFTANDDRRGMGPEGVVISHAFWQREFGCAEDAVGKPLTINDKVFTIIGVTPPEFFGLEIGRNFSVALPVSARGIWAPGVLDRRNAWWLTVMGRLKPGWDVKRAAQYFDSISPGLFEATAPSGYSQSMVDTYMKFHLTALPAAKGVSRLRTDYEEPLWLLFGITGLVLLIACTNLANLVLARASAREGEAAIRLAIGASRRRLLGQSLCESLLLASAGALLGAIFAGVLSQILIWFLSTDGNPLTIVIKTDWKLFAFTGIVAVLACVIFGLVPAWRGCMVEPLAALKGGGRGLIGRRDGMVIQRALVVSQTAVSLVLLAGALLLIRSFWNLTRIDPGFRKSGLIFASVDFSRLNLPLDGIESVKKEFMEKIRSIPNVRSVASTTHKPLSQQSWTMAVTFNGEEERKSSAKITWISPDYFRTIEIPIQAGRDINETDRAGSSKVALVNQAFVQRFCGSTNPIGLRLRTTQEPGYPQADYEIVGVVADTKYSSVRQEIWPIVYAPATQDPNTGTWMQLAIRSSTDANALLPVLQKKIQAIDPQIGLGLSVLETEVRDGMVRERLMAWLSGFFGVLAMLLVTIGLYGVISYMTVRRRNELGIRLALGAQRHDVFGLVLRQGMTLAATGIVVGIAAALGITRALGSLLFLVKPNDPLVFAGTSLLLLTVAFLACWLPARRAARVDPMIALRHE